MLIDQSSNLHDGHMPALDGLRGIAILLVMLFHFTFYGGMCPVIAIDKGFYQLAGLGWMGVDLFFVLSGFLITGILYDTKESTHFFRNFYARRFLRIFPLYYGTLFSVFIILPRIASLGPEFQPLLKEQVWYWSYLVNLRIALEDWSAFGIIEHFWSLAVEEQFYLCWPVIVFLLDKRKLMMICVIFVISSLGVRIGLVLTGYPTATNVLTPARMDALTVGALLALLARKPNRLFSLSRWAPTIAGVTAVALAIMFVWRNGLNTDDIAVQTIGYTLLAFLFGAILTLAVTQAPQTVLGKALASPGLSFFGRYSYGLYVFHHLVVFYLIKNVISVRTLPRVMGSQLPAQILFILIATSVSLVFALLSWHLYEQQFLKLKHLFGYKHQTTHIPSHA